MDGTPVHHSQFIGPSISPAHLLGTSSFLCRNLVKILQLFMNFFGLMVFFFSATRLLESQT